MTKEEKAYRKKQSWETFKLRMSLLRIWLVKNSMLFLKITLMAIFVLMLTGNVHEGTPLLGSTIYPIFKSVLDEINAGITSGFGAATLDILGAVVSLIFTLLLFRSKLRSIAIDDIKSKKMKVALLKAGLYFDENGQLVQRLENATSSDLNQDGKVGTNNAAINIIDEGLFSGIKRAGKELKIVLTAKIIDDVSYQRIVANAGLKQTSDALNITQQPAAEETQVITIGNGLETVSVIETEADIMEKEELHETKPLFETQDINENNLDDRVEKIIEEKTEQAVDSVVGKDETLSEYAKESKKNLIKKIGHVLKRIAIAIKGFFIELFSEDEKKEKKKEEKKTVEIKEESTTQTVAQSTPEVIANETVIEETVQPDTITEAQAVETPVEPVPTESTKETVTETLKPVTTPVSKQSDFISKLRKIKR